MIDEKIEITIQRLVDCELSDQQRGEFLKLAHANPELWRQMALAFVEDRIWSSVVVNSAIVDSQTTHPLVTDGRSGCGVGTGKTEIEKAGLPTRSWWQQNGPRILMTAAAVMFALTVALRFNPVERNDIDRPQDGQDIAQSPFPAHPRTPDTATGESVVGPGTLVSNTEPYQLRMNDNFQVPLFEDVSQMQEEIEKFRSGFDQATLQRFLQAGYQVEPNIDYITGNSQDGRSFVVPIQNYRVKRFMQ